MWPPMRCSSATCWKGGFSKMFSSHHAGSQGVVRQQAIKGACRSVGTRERVGAYVTETQVALDGMVGGCGVRERTAGISSL